MKLALRPTKLKIKVGVIADAAVGPFKCTDPGSSLDRLLSDDFSHEYKVIWQVINYIYYANQWNELSNERLDQKCNQIVSQGYDGLPIGPELCYVWHEGEEYDESYHCVSITPKDIKDASQRWIKHGWLNYEEKRADKLKNAGRAAKWTALLTGGGSIFGL